MKCHPCTGRSWGLLCTQRDTCAHHQAFSGPVNDVHEPLNPYARSLCGQGLPDYRPVAIQHKPPTTPQLDLFS